MARKPQSQPPQELVMITARIPRDLAGTLKIVAIEREVERVEPSTVQGIVADAVRDWLKAHGYTRKR